MGGPAPPIVANVDGDSRRDDDQPLDAGRMSDCTQRGRGLAVGRRGVGRSRGAATSHACPGSSLAADIPATPGADSDTRSPTHAGPGAVTGARTPTCAGPGAAIGTRTPTCAGPDAA